MADTPMSSQRCGGIGPHPAHPGSALGGSGVCPGVPGIPAIKPPRHSCPSCDRPEPTAPDTETMRGGRRLRTPDRTETGATTATAQANGAATGDTPAGNEAGAASLRDRITRAIDDVFEQWTRGLGEQRPQDALADAVHAALRPELDELAEARADLDALRTLTPDARRLAAGILGAEPHRPGAAT